MIKKFSILILLLFLITLVLLYPNPYTPTPTFAQQSCPIQTNNPRAGGLISAPDLIASDNKFSNAAGVCVIDPKAAFIPFRIPTYAELESLYFDQSKLPPTQKIIINEDNQSLIDLSDT